jgi:hypothetical protein
MIMDKQILNKLNQLDERTFIIMNSVARIDEHLKTLNGKVLDDRNRISLVENNYNNLTKKMAYYAGAGGLLLFLVNLAMPIISDKLFKLN